MCLVFINSSILFRHFRCNLIRHLKVHYVCFKIKYCKRILLRVLNLKYMLRNLYLIKPMHLIVNELTKLVQSWQSWYLVLDIPLNCQTKSEKGSECLIIIENLAEFNDDTLRLARVVTGYEVWFDWQQLAKKYSKKIG